MQGLSSEAPALPSPTISQVTFEELIAAARLAPSPDNNQPWRFAPDEASILVHHNRQRALPSDARDLFSWIALGAAIENIAICASQFHLRAEVEYFPRPFLTDELGEQVAAVHLKEGGAPDLLSKMIEHRVTNRRFYDSTPLSSHDCAQLDAATGPHGQVSWLTSRSDLRQFAKLVGVADRIRFEHRPFHDEFHAVLRFGSHAAQSSGDGLELKTLELPRPAGLLFRLLKPWTRMRLANLFGLSRAFANYSRKQIQKSGGVGLLVTSHISDAGYLEAGRMFERIWLKATALGLAFQPLGSLPLFLTKYEVEGDLAFAPHHARRIGAMKPALQKLCPTLERGSLIMAFRVGQATPPSARSHRLPVSQLLFPSREQLPCHRVST